MGPQPAVVVGPSGEEIYTDKYGRVKVQFFWDRMGKKDENSSCWIRVSQVWAGKNWGAMFLPRIGQEVIVDFLEGDPDQPLVTGRVYNADQMPPYDIAGKYELLRGHIAQLTKGGGSDNFNALHFDDTKSNEMIWLRAEKDMSVAVKHDQTITVKNDRTESVEEGNEKVEIKKGNRDHTVSKGNESLTVSQGTRTVTVQGDDTHTVKTGNHVVTVNTGNDTHTVKTGNREVDVNTGNDTHNVKTGNRTVEVSMGNDSLTVKMGNQTTKLNLGAASTEAMQSITLKVGANSITIDQTGVTIKGMMISIEGQVQSEVKGLLVSVSADAMLQAKGAITMIG